MQFSAVSKCTVERVSSFNSQPQAHLLASCCVRVRLRLTVKRVLPLGSRIRQSSDAEITMARILTNPATSFLAAQIMTATAGALVGILMRSRTPAADG